MKFLGIFEPKSWWKYDIYWLLKSSCFNLFGNGKYGLFLSQEVDGKMIFTGYWEVLVLNFSVMGNTVFFQSKSWWKDDIYVVFLSFLWYSRTWEIWFFGQWYVDGISENLQSLSPYKPGPHTVFSFLGSLVKKLNYQDSQY